jgi:hypothetical protein
MDITLEAGQTLRTALRERSQLVMLEGSATVQLAPVWVADALLLHPPMRLREGDTYLGANGGCIVVAAGGSCRVLVLKPPGLWPRLLHRLASLPAKAWRQPRRLQTRAC